MKISELCITLFAHGERMCYCILMIKQTIFNRNARKVAKEFMKKRFNVDVDVKENKNLTGHDCVEHGIHNVPIDVWEYHMKVMHKDVI